MEVFLGSTVLERSLANPLRVLRVLRIIRTFRVLDRSVSVIQRAINRLILSIVSVLFCSAGIILYLELGYQTLTFHESIYFIIITIATVGYGDITPKSEQGKMFILFTVIFTGFLVPYQIGKVIQVLNSFQGHSVTYAKKELVEHVIVTGTITTSGLIDFLREFITRANPKNGNSKNIQVVILTKKELSHEIKQILWNPFFDKWIKIVRGSSVVRNDLIRVSLQEAQSCFILANKNSKNPSLEDSANVMSAMSVKDLSPNLKTYVQLITSLRKENLRQFGIEGVISIKNMKMEILALNCMYPGTSTFIANLTQTHNSATIPDRAPLWEKEYSRGLAMETYTVVLPKAFKNKTFDEVSRIIYDHLSIILFGIVVEDINGNFVCLLNPGNTYFINTGDIGYVIADSSETASRVSLFKLSPRQINSSRIDDGIYLCDKYSFQDFQYNYIDDDDDEDSNYLINQSKIDFEKITDVETESESESGSENANEKKRINKKQSIMQITKNKSLDFFAMGDPSVLDEGFSESSSSSHSTALSGENTYSSDLDPLLAKQSNLLKKKKGHEKRKKKGKRKGKGEGKGKRKGKGKGKGKGNKAPNVNDNDSMVIPSKSRLVGRDTFKLFDRNRNSVIFDNASGILGNTPQRQSFFSMQSESQGSTFHPRKHSELVKELNKVNDWVKQSSPKKVTSKQTGESNLQSLKYKDSFKKFNNDEQSLENSLTSSKNLRGDYNNKETDIFGYSMMNVGKSLSYKKRDKQNSYLETVGQIEKKKKIDQEGYRRIETQALLFVGESSENSEDSLDSEENENTNKQKEHKEKLKNKSIDSNKEISFVKNDDDDSIDEDKPKQGEDIGFSSYSSSDNENDFKNKKDEEKKEKEKEKEKERGKGKEKEKEKEDENDHEKDFQHKENVEDLILENCRNFKNHLILLADRKDLKDFVISLRNQEMMKFIDEVTEKRQTKLKSIHFGIEFAENNQIIEGSSSENEILEEMEEEIEPFEPMSIIYLTDQLPTQKEYEELKQDGQAFINVFFLKGSPFSWQTWSLLNLEYAKHVVILPDFSNYQKHSSSSKKGTKHEYIIDSDTVYISRLLMGLDKYPDLTLELIHPTNISFFEFSNIQIGEKDLEYMKTSQIKQIAKSFPIYALNPVFASGKIFTEVFFDGLFAHSHFTPDILQIMKKFIQSTKLQISPNIQQSRFFSVPLIPTFNRKKFKDLFHYMLEEKNTLVVGLLRAENPKFLGNIMPYVLTNPDPNTICYLGDNLFILGGNWK
ncbi:calcium-activated potassium channel alpha chain [Anaeramoeba flamelloides]|uniref:Calcium-activated potassium channel alpha chain n=1 Tax=Anaeramoeba flamelloides TaxID=1746091 RepID=A0ABQ8Z3K7_9EUKA|nr:calcium-activated potassium channel alpha chain [Anaeramoeba flamelloides]